MHEENPDSGVGWNRREVHSVRLTSKPGSGNNRAPASLDLHCASPNGNHSVNLTSPVTRRHARHLGKVSQNMDIRRCTMTTTIREPRAICLPAVKTAEHRWTPTSGILQNASSQTKGIHKYSSSVTNRAMKIGPQSNLASPEGSILSERTTLRKVGKSHRRQKYRSPAFEIAQIHKDG